MPAGPVIVDNTPLVALWTLRRLDLFQLLFDEVLAPAAVYAEFLATERALRQSALATASWIRPASLADPRRADTFVGIGRGEAEVLNAGAKSDMLLMVVVTTCAIGMRDDAMPLTGTMGLLVQAKREGYLTEVAPLIHGGYGVAGNLSPHRWWRMLMRTRR